MSGRVLVLGASGFIGARVAAAFSEAGWTVRAGARRPAAARPREPWLVAAYALYGLIGACWLPVVAIQMRLSRLAGEAAAAEAPLPPAYHRLFRLWFALGWPAFAALIGIYVLMIVKPAF